MNVRDSIVLLHSQVRFKLIVKYHSGNGAGRWPSTLLAIYAVRVGIVKIYICTVFVVYIHHDAVLFTVDLRDTFEIDLAMFLFFCRVL